MPDSVKLIKCGMPSPVIAWRSFGSLGALHEVPRWLVLMRQVDIGKLAAISPLLHGLSLEETDHGIEGGLFVELLADRR